MGHIHRADVLLRIEENLDDEQRIILDHKIREDEGVVSVDIPQASRHMMLVHYNPEMTQSWRILRLVNAQGIHADIAGF